MNGLFVDEAQDNTSSHIDDMASKAFAHATMTYAKVASRWEQEGAPADLFRGTSDPASSSAKPSGSTPMTMAAQMNLLFKDIGGKKYRACTKQIARL